jgi:hypothetical protein
MSGQRVRVIVNDTPVEVWPWARWRDAVTAWEPDAGASLSTGQGMLHDDVGQPVDPDGHVVEGARIRFRLARAGTVGEVER